MKFFKPSTALVLTTAIMVMISLPATAGTDCGELFDKNCTTCHYKTRICQKIGQKSKRGWKITVKRMLRYGLRLDKTGQKKIIECLTKLEKGSKLVCE